MKVEIDIVDEFERKFGKGAAFSRAREFMIGYPAQMQAAQPELALRGIEIAKQFQTGATTTEELKQTRVACWEYLSEHEVDIHPETPQYSIIRAVLCALYDGTTGSEDAFDTIDCFLNFANRFEDHSKSANDLLKKCFSS